ncbi:diheme cytochrome c-553 [Piscinibacter sp.]|uniref:diheme cytochrome c-553 n=1 Tax=Piscinibacter sp. TaxID=1903157 RepID=UPI002BB80938|nr:diheme cytochrome c-553 [Albitalea sp.]HUG25924.1 diheme cytochrome c-553 [Albitalea sp.]
MTHHPIRRAACTAVLSLFAALGLSIAAPTTAADNAHHGDSKVKHGKYLVNTSGCIDCHTPLKMGPNGPEPDMSRHLSGHPEGLAMPPVPRLPEGPWLVVLSATNTAFAGPWGVSFTANLTPDPDTGLGQWTARNFKDTIRTGRHMGRGRPVLPPMPIPVYNNFTDEDLEAMFAYLQTLPAVENRVPEPWSPQGAAGSAGK